MTDDANTNIEGQFDHALHRAVFAAAFACAAEGRWRQVSLAEIYERAGISDHQSKPPFRCKIALLTGFAKWVDDEVTTMAGEAEELSPRDRLFDLLMLRFDVLAPYRDGVTSIIRSLPSMPMTAVAGGPGLAKSMRLTLTLAGLSSSGLTGMLRGKGLAFVYLNALRTWLDDDSQDLSATMKAVDQGLVKAEEVALSMGLAAEHQSEK